MLRRPRLEKGCILLRAELDDEGCNFASLLRTVGIMLLKRRRGQRTAGAAPETRQ